jgi:hypothetical protein
VSAASGGSWSYRIPVAEGALVVGKYSEMARTPATACFFALIMLLEKWFVNVDPIEYHCCRTCQVLGDCVEKVGSVAGKILVLPLVDGLELVDRFGLSH